MLVITTFGWAAVYPATDDSLVRAGTVHNIERMLPWVIANLLIKVRPELTDGVCEISGKFVDGFEGWAIYAGTLRNQQIMEDELDMAIRAREHTKVGRPENPGK